jgi:hypothetical protein
MLSNGDNVGRGACAFSNQALTGNDFSSIGRCDENGESSDSSLLKPHFCIPQRDDEEDSESDELGVEGVRSLEFDRRILERLIDIGSLFFF